MAALSGLKVKGICLKHKGALEEGGVQRSAASCFEFETFIADIDRALRANAQRAICLCCLDREVRGGRARREGAY